MEYKIQISESTLKCKDDDLFVFLEVYNEVLPCQFCFTRKYYWLTPQSSIYTELTQNFSQQPSVGWAAGYKYYSLTRKVLNTIPSKTCHYIYVSTILIGSDTIRSICQLHDIYIHWYCDNMCQWHYDVYMPVKLLCLYLCRSLPRKSKAPKNV